MASARKLLPYAAAENVNQAAELMVAADSVLGPLEEERPILREEIQARTARARRMITQALRHLESAGAKTRP